MKYVLRKQARKRWRTDSSYTMFEKPCDARRKLRGHTREKKKGVRLLAVDVVEKKKPQKEAVRDK